MLQSGRFPGSTSFAKTEVNVRKLWAQWTVPLCCVSNPLLRRKKRVTREVKEVAQGHPTSWQQPVSSPPRLLLPTLMSLG